MRNMLVGLVGLGTLCLFSACSGSNKGSTGSCGTPGTCGGDIVGTWKVSSSCITADASSIADASSMMDTTNCPSETANTSGMTVSGTVTYGADLTYSSNLTLAGNLVVNVPAACLTQQGVTVTCAQLQQVLSGDATSTGATSASCAEAGSGCACTLALSPQATTDTGTYSTANGVLTQTSTGGTPDDSNYCQQGSTLTLSQGSDSGMMSSGLGGSMVLTKQ